jgi:beta-N-acetylhexosaminidase
VIGDPTIPTSVSSEVMKGLVRDALGFEGVIVTDALDMGGFGVRSPDETLSAGADLVLYGPGQLGRLPETSPADSPRLASLLDWLGDDGEPSVVAEASHLELASELAARSITLVRDDAGTLPLRPGPDDRILTVMPRPIDLTPADTSSYVDPGLAAAVRMFHQGTSEVVVSQEPPPEEVRRVIAAAREHTVVVLGTIDAGPSQADLVRAILQTGVPTVTVALRTPYDLAGYPQSNTHLASFGILPPTMRAVAGVLFGAGVSGSLPVAIPGLYAVGHGIHRVSAMSQEAPH